MQIFQVFYKLKSTIKLLWLRVNTKPDSLSSADRISRLERNYLVLLKRVLEMDGVKLITSNKASAMSSKVFQTISSDDNKGLNESKPTIH